MRVRVTDGIDPRVAVAEFGWWFPEQSRPATAGASPA